MSKNVINAFGDMKVLVDKDGGIIRWEFLRHLYELQSRETFHIANKITRDHVYYQSQKMNVKLAVQVFGDRTAQAIDYCRTNLKLVQFANSAPTTRFLRVIGEIFDLLNSKSKYGRWSKAPLKETKLLDGST